MFDTKKQSYYVRYLTVREGWFLGYPIIGEAPIQLVQAKVSKPGGHWHFIVTDDLTQSEWERLAAANYQHHYLLAGGTRANPHVATEWMLLVGRPIAAQFSTMRHFEPRTKSTGGGIGV